jgi:hypothetical protein
VSIKVKSFSFFFLLNPLAGDWSRADISLSAPPPRRPYKGVHIHKRGRVETVGGWLRDDSPRLFYPDGMRERKKKLRHKTEDTVARIRRERDVNWIVKISFFLVWAH